MDAAILASAIFLKIGEIWPMDWPATRKQKNVEIISDALNIPVFVIIIDFPMKNPYEYKDNMMRSMNPEAREAYNKLFITFELLYKSAALNLFASYFYPTRLLIVFIEEKAYIFNVIHFTRSQKHFRTRFYLLMLSSREIWWAGTQLPAWMVKI